MKLNDRKHRQHRHTANNNMKSAEARFYVTNFLSELFGFFFFRLFLHVEFVYIHSSRLIPEVRSYERESKLCNQNSALAAKDAEDV